MTTQPMHRALDWRGVLRLRLSRHSAPSGAVVGLLSLALFAMSGRSLAADKTPVDIPYYLPVDLSQLAIAVEKTEIGKVSRVVPVDPAQPVSWKFKRSVTLERAGELALKTVADPAAKREFRIPKATLSDVKATVELSESGLLAAINTSAAGRGDDLLLAVAKFAGVAAGFWTGSPYAGLLYSTAAGQAHAMAHPLAIPGLPPPPPPSPCPPIDQLEVEGVPVEMQALVSLDPAGCTAFLHLREANKTLEARRIERDQLAAEIPGASGAELSALNKKLQNSRLEVTYAEAVRAERREALAARYDKFVAARCLGKKISSEASRELLALDRLPSAKTLGWLAPNPDLTRVGVAKALTDGGWSEMNALFARTGVVATLDEGPAQARGAQGNPIPVMPPTAAPEIAWRQAVPVRVRIWTLAGAKDSTEQTGNDANACEPDAGDDPDAKANAELAFDGILDVLHPHSPVRALPVEAKAFADRSLAIGFDLRGRPRKIDTSGSSSAAGFAQAAAAAAQGFRDEYDATLKKRVSIEESKRELALDGLNDEIAALEAQKKALDARAELLGAEGSFDDIVARQRLDSELKLLEAQVALRMAEATAEQRVAIAELEKRVLETQKRLALLEAEQALEEALRRR